MAALGREDRPWRTVLQNGGLDETTSTVRSDLAATAWLASAVPADLVILSQAQGRPVLPLMAVTLHLSAAPTLAGVALAAQIRRQLSRRRGPSAA